MNATDVYAPVTKKARIEIIPLIDVIFFLLATFVLFTLSLETIRGIEVPLPRGTPEGEDTALFLQASDTNIFYWKEGRHGVVDTITAAELPARLAEFQKRVANPRVIVRGDLRAKFGAAVMALDEVRRAKINQVSVETVATPTGR